MRNNPFATRMAELASVTRTENGATAYNTTESPLLDLFAVIGALRETNSDSVNRLYRMIDGAYLEDRGLLAKMLFYARDILGGLGERETFRTAIHYCAVNYPDIVRKNIRMIPVFGRWDDMFALVGTGLEDEMWAIMKEVYDADLRTLQEGGKSVTLLAKWLPSADASSENTRKKGCYAAKRLSTSVYNYKREVKALRRIIDTIESHISANDWHSFDYSKVPSKAMLKYSTAFYRNDGERYTNYLSDVSSGKAKIHSATLYPADIMSRLEKSRSGKDDQVCEQLWNNLPNFVTGENNYIVMADVSGSMYGLPMNTAIGLAIYFAERNKGPFKDLFMTFSATPEIIRIPPHYKLRDKYRLVHETEWGNNTNIESAFQMILDVAIQSNSSQDEIPKSIIIITDMEFDGATENHRDPQSRKDITVIFDEFKKMYADAGYELPNIVFWNVNSRHDTYHAKAGEPRVQLVSGHATSTFKNLIEGLNSTPYDVMVKILSNPRYDSITV